MTTPSSESSPVAATATVSYTSSPSSSPTAAAATSSGSGNNEVKSSSSLVDPEDSGFLHLVDDVGNFGCSERGLVNLTKRAKRSTSSTGTLPPVSYNHIITTDNDLV
jgi:hypothetical protein